MKSTKYLGIDREVYSLLQLDMVQLYFSSKITVHKAYLKIVFHCQFSAPGIQKEKDKPLEELHCLSAHTGNCICLEFDATGKYFAVGAADASASIWDVSQLVCLTVLTR